MTMDLKYTSAGWNNHLFLLLLLFIICEIEIEKNGSMKITGPVIGNALKKYKDMKEMLCETLIWTCQYIQDGRLQCEKII